MDLKAIRKLSLKTAAQLGFNVTASLPLIDEPLAKKATHDVVARLLCLHVAAASAYGFDRKKAQQWLEQQALSGELSKSERAFIDHGIGDPNRFKLQIEGMWALAWSLQLVRKLDFATNCDDNFVDRLPDLRESEAATLILSNASLRSYDEILAAADLAYCLHWAMREAEIRSQPLPGRAQSYVIVERRRALDWILGSTLWDDVPLDT